MRGSGFPAWSRAVVAALENGNRGVAAGELVGLAIALGCPLTDLVRAGNRGWIALDQGIHLRPRALVALLEGRDPATLDGRSIRMAPREARGRIASEFGRYFRILGEMDSLPSPCGRGSSGSFLEASYTYLLETLVEGESGASLFSTAGSGKAAVFLALESAARGDLEQTIARRLKTDPRWVVFISYALWGQSPTEERERRAAGRPSAKQHVSREIVRELSEALPEHLIPKTASLVDTGGERGDRDGETM